MRLRLIVLAAALALALPATAAASYVERHAPQIVNGTPARPDEYPAQGWLRVDESGGTGFDFSCGGTLVAPRKFLTAAHCATDDAGEVLPARGFNVRLGNVDRTPARPDEFTGVKVEVP